MADFCISFFNCIPVPQEPQLVIPAQALDGQGSISVLSDVSGQTDTAAGYKVIDSAVRRFTRWITVTAERIYHVVVRMFRTRFRHIVRNSGVQILRQSAILRI